MTVSAFFVFVDSEQGGENCIASEIQQQSDPKAVFYLSYSTHLRQ